MEGDGVLVMEVMLVVTIESRMGSVTCIELWDTNFRELRWVRISRVEGIELSRGLEIDFEGGNDIYVKDRIDACMNSIPSAAYCVRP